MPKSTWDRLTNKGVIRESEIMVKAFDGSRKAVIGEADLIMTIGPHKFLITFQVMNINAAYSCLLGRPWIHQAGVVTSTLHQKLKFVKNGKLVVVEGEEAMLISSLSSFSYIDAKEDMGTQFQALSLESKGKKKQGASISSLKDAQELVRSGETRGWGSVLSLPDNKDRTGLGFSPEEAFESERKNRNLKQIFKSVGFINTPSPDVNVILEEGPEEEYPNFVKIGTASCNWTVVDVPFVIPFSK